MILTILKTALISIYSLAQTNVDAQEEKFFMVRPHLESSLFSLEFLPDGDADKLQWRPNTRGTLGLSFYIPEKFGFGVSFKSSLPSESLRKNGRTEYMDLRFRLPIDPILFAFKYQNYEGFYLYESFKHDESLDSTDPNIHDESMRLEHLSLASYYVLFKNDFSLEAALDQTVRQKKSGGSWVFSATGERTSTSTDDSFVPTRLQDEFSSTKDVKQIQLNSLVVSGGGGFTYVFRESWFASVLGLLGFGPQERIVKSEHKTKYYFGGISKSETVLSMGYNGDSFYSGAVITSEISTHSLTGTSTTFTTLLFYYGLRF